MKAPENSLLDDFFFTREAYDVAPDLLGRILVYGSIKGIIVETEAYHEDDPASHSFRGKTRRNSPMFLPGGYTYVYRIYGIHLCFNVVTGSMTNGQAVLIRACQPLGGVRKMWLNRYGVEIPPEVEVESMAYRKLTDGPGKLTSAFGITVEECNGIRIGFGKISILHGFPAASEQIGCSPRTGITPGKGSDTLWRWYVRGNRFVSR